MRDISISLAEGTPVPLPTSDFSVRQISGFWRKGNYYVYADVVPWSNPYHPDTYDTSIHDDRFVLAVIEHFKSGGLKTGLYVSKDGKKFRPSRPHFIEDLICFLMTSPVARHPGLIPGPDREHWLFNACGSVEERGHYTQWIYRVRVH